MALPKIRGMKPVGRDGELILYADSRKAVGLLYNEATKAQTPKRPLQVFFKWGRFIALEESR